jgi:hypothetical protein
LDHTEDKLEKLAYGFFTLVFTLTTTFFEPWVITKMWAWYLVPLGVSAIGWAQAFGLNLLVYLFIGPPLNAQKERSSEWRLKRSFVVLFGVAFTFGLGWFVHKDQ